MSSRPRGRRPLVVVGPDVVGEAAANLLGTAAVQALKIASQQILDRRAIHQILNISGRLSHCVLRRVS
jgi:hypothetical protein